MGCIWVHVTRFSEKGALSLAEELKGKGDEDKRTRTLNQAHARIDGMEKEFVEIKTTMHFFKEFIRIRRLEMILIAIIEQAVALTSMNLG